MARTQGFIILHRRCISLQDLLDHSEVIQSEHAAPVEIRYRPSKSGHQFIFESLNGSILSIADVPTSVADEYFTELPFGVSATVAELLQYTQAVLQEGLPNSRRWEICWKWMGRFVPVKFRKEFFNDTVEDLKRMRAELILEQIEPGEASRTRRAVFWLKVNGPLIVQTGILLWHLVKQIWLPAVRSQKRTSGE